MSTMYEALKKAEAERNTASRGASGQQKPGPSSSMGPLVVILAVIFVGLVGWNIYRGQAAASAQRAAATRVAAERQAAEMAAKAKAAAQPVATQAAAVNVRHPEGTYGVDGIIAAGPASMAIINGKVISIGGKIGPLTLQAVSAKSVEVLDSRDNTVHSMKVE